jgi:HD-GYP domain-containing protein (c-di-GMP phosphodiesterase class II)
MAKEELDAASMDESFIPLGLGGARFQRFIVRHMEGLFVLLLLMVVVAVFYFLPYKVAFLNLFYLPVLSAAYVLGKRKAVMMAALCFLLCVLFAYYRPDLFEVAGTRLNALLVLATWGGFLILATAWVGSLREVLATRWQEQRRLNQELKKINEELKDSRATEEMTEEIKDKMEKTLYATMDPVVAKLATEDKLRFEKREISIMFTDLTNFTSYSDRNRPDVVLEELNRFLGQMEPILERFRGHIDKYMGDGVMVEFGAPLDYDRHALMAVVAGLKMQQKVSTLSLPWRMRVGIATGSTIVGMLGVKRQAYSAVGDRVNVAKRLEEICVAGQVYIDEPTFRAVEPFVVATQHRNVGDDPQAESVSQGHVTDLEEQLSQEGESPELLYKLGKAKFDAHDATAAIRCFERALTLDPESTEIKLAYADASIRRDEFEKIQLKGKSQKITVYEVSGLKDRWNDPAVIPPPIATAYSAAQSHIEIPDDVVLGVEVLDGAVGHCRVVALLSYALADRLKLTEELKKIVLQAGYLQDIGKEAVPHHVLNSVGSLTDQESKLVEKYVAESVSACRRMGYVDPRLLEIVLHHHEAWDGNGYPDHLRGESIPLGARITGVAEAYSALTSWRPYHDPWDARVAMSELRKGVQKGRYDPKVVEALLDMFHPFGTSS